jgi:hypothetical protein
MVQRELSRRAIDISLCDIRVSHGVCYIRGVVSKMRGHDIDLAREMAIIQGMLRQKGIREVIVEATLKK